jgi:hypothetical protein
VLRTYLAVGSPAPSWLTSYSVSGHFLHDRHYRGTPAHSVPPPPTTRRSGGGTTACNDRNAPFLSRPGPPASSARQKLVTVACVDRVGSWVYRIVCGCRLGTEHASAVGRWQRQGVGGSFYTIAMPGPARFLIFLSASSRAGILQQGLGGLSRAGVLLKCYTSKVNIRGRGGKEERREKRRTKK